MDMTTIKRIAGDALADLFLLAEGTEDWRNVAGTASVNLRILADWLDRSRAGASAGFTAAQVQEVASEASGFNG